ncbi:MAG: 4-hydroxy-tetrahydrodipicolinate reductase, partial [Cytophagales bacterium]
NFSLGVNLFFKLNETLALLMKPYTDYAVSIDETHHTQKKDAPSGTAITLAEGIIKNQPLKKNWVLNGTNAATNTEQSVVITSHRIDPVPGTHTVSYRSAIDDIQITHTAHSRHGFALGAVLVAEWLKGKTGVFKMDDFLGF